MALAKGKLWYLVATGVALLVMAWIAVATYRIESTDRPELRGDGEPIDVEVVVVRRGKIRSWVYGGGVARAARRDFLTFAAATGRVKYVIKDDRGRRLDVGDRVRGPREGEEKGDLIAHLENEREKEAYEAAKARHEQELEREAAAERALETLRNTPERASEIAAAEAELKAAQVAAQSARLAKEQAYAEVEETRIYASFDGVIAAITISEGDDYEKPADKNWSDRQLYELMPAVIADPSQYEIAMKVDSRYGRLVKEGQTAYILLPDEMAQPSENGDPSENIMTQSRVIGTVFSVTPGGVSDPNSNIVVVRAAPGTEELYDGMTLKVWIAISEFMDTVAVPIDAIVWDEEMACAYVVSEKTRRVERRQLTLGVRSINEYEVIDGLNEGEWVVTRGRFHVGKGDEVRVLTEGLLSTK